MQDKVRSILIAAVEAGRHGAALDPQTIQAITEGKPELPLAQLGFDSLAWMEFCISVELQSGQELEPDDIAGMVYLRDVEAWLRARL
jgi:hypothetical protein